MTTMEAIDRAVRRAKIVGWATSLVAFLISLLIYAAVNASPTQSTMKDVLLAITQSVWVGSPVLGYVVYARRLPVTDVVVWLRRFRPSDGGRFNFPEVLGRATAGLAHPVTLQDKSVPASLFAAGVRASTTVLWLSISAAWLLGLLIVAFLASALGLELGGIMIIVLLYSAAFAFGAWSMVKRLGFRSLDPVTGVSEVNTLIASVRSGGRHIGIGIDVMRCPGELWKEVVYAFLEGAAVVIVDVTEMTANIEDELEWAFSVLGPEHVILTVEDDGPPAERIWNDICVPARERSGRALSREWLATALLRYPSAAGSVNPRAQRPSKEQVGQLRRALAARVPASA